MTMMLSDNAADLMRSPLKQSIIRLHNDYCFSGAEKQASLAFINNPATTTEQLMAWKERLKVLQAQRPKQPWQADEVYHALPDFYDLPESERLSL
jgi:hypothetical protein